MNSVFSRSYHKLFVITTNHQVQAASLLSLTCSDDELIITKTVDNSLRAWRFYWVDISTFRCWQNIARRAECARTVLMIHSTDLTFNSQQNVKTFLNIHRLEQNTSPELLWWVKYFIKKFFRNYWTCFLCNFHVSPTIRLVLSLTVFLREPESPISRKERTCVGSSNEECLITGNQVTRPEATRCFRKFDCQVIKVFKIVYSTSWSSETSFCCFFVNLNHPRHQTKKKHSTISTQQQHYPSIANIEILATYGKCEELHYLITSNERLRLQ